MTARAPAKTRLAARKRAIFACCSLLGIDEDARHDMLGSTKAMTLTQADAALDRLRLLGADRQRPTGRPKGAPTTLDREPTYQKIEALLTDMELSWAYADAIGERITGGKSGGIPRLGWVKDGRHLRGIITALMVEKGKRLDKAWAALDAALQARGRDLEWCKARAAALGRLTHPWPWRECLGTLRILRAELEQITPPFAKWGLRGIAGGAGAEVEAT